MRKIKSSTATALLSLSIGMNGLIVIVPTSTMSAENFSAPNYAYIAGLQNRNSYIGQNRNITMNNDNCDILTQKNLSELKNCINEEPAEFGEDISYIDFFYMLRKQENYENILQQFISLPKRYQLSLAVMLSQINQLDLKSSEKEFIIDLLHEDLLSSQEYAINTISIWNAPELLPDIIDAHIENRYLQKRYEKIINRFKEMI